MVWSGLCDGIVDNGMCPGDNIFCLLGYFGGQVSLVPAGPSSLFRPVTLLPICPECWECSYVPSWLTLETIFWVWNLDSFPGLMIYSSDLSHHAKGLQLSHIILTPHAKWPQLSHIVPQVNIQHRKELCHKAQKFGRLSFLNAFLTFDLFN